MKRLLVLSLLACGCVDFDAIAVDACKTKGLCDASHPTESIENLGYCAPCTMRLQCGGGLNRCVRVGNQSGVCGVACNADGSCAPGSTCSSVRLEDGGSVGNCLPTFPLQCDGGLRTDVVVDPDAGQDAGTVDAGPADAGLADGG